MGKWFQTENSRLSARLVVPVQGAWQRMYAGPKRTRILEEAFDPSMKAGVVGLAGPRGSGKSTIALAACDFRNVRAVFASRNSDWEIKPPSQDICLVIDPVSAFDRRELLLCVQEYKYESLVLLVDRLESRFRGLLDEEKDTTIRLRLPSAQALSAYIQNLLANYQSDLNDRQYLELGDKLHGLSFHQVNQIAVDAALSRLQWGEPVNLESFQEAIQAFSAIRKQAATTRQMEVI